MKLPTFSLLLASSASLGNSFVFSGTSNFMASSFLSNRPINANAFNNPNQSQSISHTHKIHHLAAASSDDDSNTSNTNNNETAEKKAKRAALDGVLQKIERSYGRGSIVKLGDADNMKVESISTGALTLDAALGGGYPKGRVIEIYGPESSGKTTLALHAIAESQKAGGVAAFVDAEHALDPVYAGKLGIDVDDLLVSQPDSGEMALDIVDQLVRSSAVDVIVVDSVAALVPRAELEGDMSDQQIGLQARLMSKAMRKITGSLAMSKCTVIFINQLRSKVGVIYGSPEVTSGGMALKFYSSVRLDIRRKEVLPDNAGIRAKVKVVKNKVAAPFKVVTLDILFGSGIDSMGCVVDAALELGIIVRKGSWYSFKNENFAQGKFNAAEYLKEHPDLADEIADAVQNALSDHAEEFDQKKTTSASASGSTKKMVATAVAVASSKKDADSGGVESSDDKGFD